MTRVSGATLTAAILPVEEEPLIRMLASDVLVEHGYRIVEAANAREALTLLDVRDDVRVLATDVRMPGPIDGFALARLSAKRWPHIAIIITSSHALPRDSTMPDGALFLGKSYQPAILPRKIAALVEERAANNAKRANTVGTRVD